MISVSFLGIKENLKENLQKLDKMNISYFHFDIMDGHFVPNKTWDFEEIFPIVKDLQKPFDIHLMVSNVETYIEKFGTLNPSYLTFHIEAEENPIKIIQKIKEKGIKVGISIKPNTPLEKIIPYLSFVDLVLVMSVEPGKGGQPFLKETLPRIQALKERREKNHDSYIIEVDGGINPDNKKQCEKLGADLFVVGSYITKKDDYEKAIALLNQ